MSNFTINRVVLVGRLTRDPELRALPSGTNVCGLRLACNSSRRDAEGSYSDKPNFFDVSVYGGSAENVSRYTRRGGRVAIDGRLEWREWETSDQQRRQAVSVVADTVLFLDSPGERQEGSGHPGSRPGEGDEGSEALDGRELVGAGVASEGDLVF